MYSINKQAKQKVLYMNNMILYSGKINNLLLISGIDMVENQGNKAKPMVEETDEVARKLPMLEMDLHMAEERTDQGKYMFCQLNTTTIIRLFNSFTDYKITV